MGGPLITFVDLIRPFWSKFDLEHNIALHVSRLCNRRIEEAEPGRPLPQNYARLEGGWMIVYPNMKGPDAKQSMTYLQVTMAGFTAFLSVSGGGKPIVDQTRLAGKYDFDLPLLIDPNAPETLEGSAPAPRPDAAHAFDWAASGLELKPIKLPAQNLVVDHIERPSAN